MPKYNIIIPADMNPHPKSYEESAAAILANYFKSNAYFIKKASYSTSDIRIRNIEWELKSPVGNSSDTIERNMRQASHQSDKIVIDLRRIKLHQNRVYGYIRHFLKNPNTLKRVLVITKSGKVIVFL